MRNINTHQYEVELFKNEIPRMRYTEGDFATWQKEARAKLWELLGLDNFTYGDEVVIEYTKENTDFVEHRMLIETERGYYTPCHLLIPKRVTRPPLTICLSGHGGGMHVALGRAKCEKDEIALSEWEHRAMAPRSIREGRAALVVESRSFGECSLEGYGTSCTEAAKIALLLGRTVLGEKVWDCMRILDVITARFPEIDYSDIVCTGNSGGGTATFYLAAIDERITAAMPSCSVCTFEESIAAKRHCMCNYIPGIRRYFEMGDMAGLIAPRLFIMAAGKQDPGFYMKGSYDAYEQALTAYTAAGCPERCCLEVDEGGHLNYADHLWRRFNFFKK